MKYSLSWKSNRSSTIQNIFTISWNMNFHYRIHSSTPPVPVMSQKNPVQDIPYRFLKIHFDIIFPSTPRYSKWSFSFQTVHTFLFFPTCATCSAHFFLLDLITLMTGNKLTTKSAKLTSPNASEYKSKCGLSAVAADESTKWCNRIHSPLNVN